MTAVREARAAPAVLDRAAALVDPVLRAAVARLDGDLARVAEYHLGFVDADGRPSHARGKGLRGALAILSAEAVGAPAATGVPGAAAVELLHNYSLVHDDVMDGDRERRHRPTVWALHGVPTAILVGDALANLAVGAVMHAARGRDAVAELVCANGAMIVGQGDDMAFETRVDVSIAESLTMTARKTGALLSCAAAIGALLADAPSSAVDALRDYGSHLGLAFQAADDLLGIWGDPARTGKPRGSDLASRKKSIPITAAIGADCDTSIELRALLRAGTALDEDALARAADLVEAAGGRAAAEQLADESLWRACEALEGVDLAVGAVGELHELAHFAVEREH